MKNNKSIRETLYLIVSNKFLLLLKEYMPFNSTWLLNNNFAEAQNSRSVLCVYRWSMKQENKLTKQNEWNESSQKKNTQGLQGSPTVVHPPYLWAKNWFVMKLKFKLWTLTRKLRYVLCLGFFKFENNMYKWGYASIQL